MTDTIASQVTKCLGLFRALVDQDPPGIANEKPIDPKHLETFQDELSRFKVWSGNMGAHKTGTSSLDYRLRDATHIRNQVFKLVRDLISLIQDATEIASGEMTPWDEMEDDPVDNEVESDGESPETELEQIAADVADVVNCLLRLSVDIKNPAPHQRFIETASTDTTFYEPFDTQHVYSKFVNIQPWLAGRLGKAISRRRQYFRYRESHHAKLSAGLEHTPNAPPPDSETIASSIPHALKDKPATPAARIVLEDNNSDAGVSQTSYATSAANPGSLKIPPLPQEAHKGPFQCPFCYMMIIANNRAAWKKHVYSDLKPYTCLVEDCVAPEREFGRRHEWMEHVQRNHWYTYRCPYGCETRMNSPAECKTHFQVHQTDCPRPSVELDAFVKFSEQRLDISKGLSCPLCQDTLYSLKQYQQHVGRHQEQLSLFALPSVQGGESDEDDHDEEIDTNEAASVNSDVLNVEDVSKSPEKQRSLGAPDHETDVAIPLSPRSVPDNEIRDWELKNQDSSDELEWEGPRAEIAISRKQNRLTEEEKWLSVASYGTGVLAKGDESDEMPTRNDLNSTKTKPGLSEPEEDWEEELTRQQKSVRDMSRRFLRLRFDAFRRDLSASGVNPHQVEAVVRKVENQSEWEPSEFVPDRKSWELKEAGDALRRLLGVVRYGQSISETGNQEEALGKEIETALPVGTKPGFPKISGASAGKFGAEGIFTTDAAEERERKELTDEQISAAQKIYCQMLLHRERAMRIKYGEDPDEIDTLMRRSKDELESLSNHKIIEDPEIWALERIQELLMESSGKTHEREGFVDNEQKEPQSGQGKQKVGEKEHMYQAGMGQLGEEKGNNFEGTSMPNASLIPFDEKDLNKERLRREEEAVAKWKAKEAERIEGEATEEELKRRLKEQLLLSGLSEKEIDAMTEKEDERKKNEKRRGREEGSAKSSRPTFTRMAVRHLEIETLSFYKIEWKWDQDPKYILINRWVPEWEQNILLEHSRQLRLAEAREGDNAPIAMGSHHLGHDSGGGNPLDDDELREKSQHPPQRRDQSPEMMTRFAGSQSVQIVDAPMREEGHAENPTLSISPVSPASPASPPGPISRDPIQDNWARLREIAAERGLRREETERNVEEVREADGPIERRVARIKQRVKELTAEVTNQDQHGDRATQTQKTTGIEHKVEKSEQGGGLQSNGLSAKDTAEANEPVDHLEEFLDSLMVSPTRPSTPPDSHMAHLDHEVESSANLEDGPRAKIRRPARYYDDSWKTPLANDRYYQGLDSNRSMGPSIRPPSWAAPSLGPLWAAPSPGPPWAAPSPGPPWEPSSPGPPRVAPPLRPPGYALDHLGSSVHPWALPSPSAVAVEAPVALPSSDDNRPLLARFGSLDRLQSAMSFRPPPPPLDTPLTKRSNISKETSKTDEQ